MPKSGRYRAAGLLLACGPVAASPASAGTPQEIAERAVTQEGLAIGLASNVLQSQLEVLFVSQDGSGSLNKCNKLLQGGVGAAELTATKTVSRTVTQAGVTVFYDTACTKPYVVADATVTAVGAFGYSIVETATYVGVAGATLGTLTLSESAKFAAGNYALLGTGTFAPAAAGSTSVSLGLQCSLPSNDVPFPCTGGVAQSFPKLNRSIASLTDLMLTVSSKKPYPVSFSGSSARLLTGALGALSIGDTKTALTIDGSGAKFGSTTASGSAGGFALFPPTPTAWTVSDTAHDVMFGVAVVSDTRKNLTGSIKTISTGTTLATITLDRSGTGSISYGVGGKHAITSWTLSD